MPTVRLPPLDELARRWGEIERLLKKATERTGCYEPIDLLRLAIGGPPGIWTIWIAERDDGVIVAAVAVEVKQYPRRRILEVLFAGGSDMRHWIKPLVAALDEFGRATGCSHVASIGRRGWERAWGARFGGDVVLTRDL